MVESGEVLEVLYCGAYPLRKLSIKSSLAHCVLELILKVGCKFWDSSSALSNFERILGCTIWHTHGTCCQISWFGLCKASLAHAF